MRAYVSVHNVQSELFRPHDVSGLTDTGRGLQTKYQTKEWDHTYIMFPQLEVYRTFLFFLLPVVIALISCALLFCLYLSQYRPKKFTPVLLSEILLGLGSCQECDPKGVVAVFQAGARIFEASEASYGLPQCYQRWQAPPPMFPAARFGAGRQ